MLVTSLHALLREASDTSQQCRVGTRVEEHRKWCWRSRLYLLLWMCLHKCTLNLWHSEYC